MQSGHSIIAGEAAISGSPFSERLFPAGYAASMLQSLLKALTRLGLRIFFKPLIGSGMPLSFQRRWLALLTRTAPGPKGVERSEVRVGDVAMTRFRSAGPDVLAVGPLPPAERDAVLFIHGGGFMLGGGRTYHGFAAWIAAVTGADVYLAGYRLAPEHPHPAPGDDLFAAYVALLELGHAPGRIAIVGDSAGGALAAGLTLALPEMDVPSPAALVLISPFLDLSLSGASIAERALADPLISRRFAASGGRAHAGTLRRSDPRVSPLFADLRRLPPTLIQVGTDEILHDDSVRFADRAWAAGVEVELQSFEGMFHDFQALAASLHESRAALEGIAAFMHLRFEPRADGNATPVR